MIDLDPARKRTKAIFIAGLTIVALIVGTLILVPIYR